MSHLVSVVITTFNQEPYIREAIQSVLAQTHGDLEILVVDDGSTDGTSAVLAQFGDRIRTFRQSNQGVAGARNRGVLESTGSFVAFLDGDDRWRPDKLRRQLQAFDAHPESGLVACGGAHFDGSRVFGQLLPDRIPGAPVSTRGLPHGRCLEGLLVSNFISTTSQVMVPRAVLDEVGLSDPEFRVASDYDLYLRIASNHPLSFVPEELVEWRYLPTSVSGPADTRQFRWANDMIAVLRKRARVAPASMRPVFASAAKSRARRSARFAYYRGASGERAWSVDCLRQLLRTTAGDPVVAAYLCGSVAPQWFRKGLAPFVGSWLAKTEEHGPTL